MKLEKSEVITIDGMTLEKLQVIIEAQTKEYMSAMKKVQEQTVNTTKKINSQVDKIKGAFNKIGTVVGIALSVAAIVNFGKSCINLGSDLAEVQNVVDVTFKGLSERINQFSKNAIEQFGLSELSAKQYSSTMGAMLKSMGFTSSAAADMSMELTGLAGDMASFYNLSGDDAFAKIRSGISGETEPLKQLGINLSVANLEAYALSQGMTKSYNAMSQQEQALLRYNYLLSVTSDAQGDFARTSDSWANQTKILSERFNQLKASIGQGLINIFTPIIKIINIVISKLLIAAEAFKRFTEIITGKKSSADSPSTQIGGIADSADTATDSVGALSDATNAAGKEAKKTEEAFSGVAGFDEVNTLSKNNSEDPGSTSGTGGGAGGALSDIQDMSDFVGELAAVTDEKLNPALQKFVDKLKELKAIFKEGFAAGIGDVNLEGIKKAISGIQNNIKDIFTAPEVLTAAENWIDTITYSLGQIAGSIASIGVTIGTNLLGGIDRYLEGNKDRIKTFIVDMFDITAEISVIAGNFSQAAANIFSVFGDENGQKVTENIIGIFTDAFMGISETCGKLARDILNVITKPFIDNQEKFKSVIDELLGIVAENLATVKGVVDDTMDKIGEVYDTHIKPMFDAFAEGLSSIVSTILDAYQQYILPVLDGISKKLKAFTDEYLQPLIDKVIELIGKAASAIKDIWEQTLVPFINWFIENIAPVIAEHIENVSNVFFTLAEAVSDVISSVLDACSGLIDFIAGVFTGDWERAWEGIKTFFNGIWEAIKTIVSAIWSAISSAISTTIDSIKTKINTVLEIIRTIFSSIFTSIKNTVVTIFNAIKTTITNVITAVKTTISTVLDSIKATWNNIFDALSNKVSNIFNIIKMTISTVISAVKKVISDTINTIKETWNSVWNAVGSKINSVFDGVLKKITTVVGDVYKGIKTALKDIKKEWDGKWNDMKESVTNIFNGIWNVIKGVVNSILGGIETMANGVVKGINTVINALNNLSFTVPDWVPELGGKTFGFNIKTIGDVQIPRLAKGGIVSGPTTALIGEAGKEAVIPLENNTGWLDQIAARLGEIISVNIQSIMQENSGITNNQDTIIKTIVKLDSKTLVEQTDAYKKRKGYLITT